MSATLPRPVEAEDQQIKTRSRRLGDYWLIGCVLLALACFAVPWFNPAATQQVAETLSQKPIEHIQVGDRVRASNPNGEVDRSLGDQIQPEAWRHLKLRLAKANGGTVQIELLRPLRWVQARQAKVGQTIQLDLPEMDAVGKAEVLSLGPCPEISQGSGEVVTGTFAHEATEGNLLNVFVEGEAEPIGVTLHHPFWSETRGEFVAAEKLQPEEELRSREGDRLRVIQVLPRPGPERVYNLEVHRQHVYQIADAGIVVHNCSDPILYPPGGPSPKRPALGDGPTSRGEDDFDFLQREIDELLAEQDFFGERADLLLGDETLPRPPQWENLRWTTDDPGMSPAARDFEAGAIGARSNVNQRAPEIPVLHRTLENGTKAPVKFDGIENNVLIDRKLAVTTFPKSKNQALRQSQALAENGFQGRWEVTSTQEAGRAKQMFQELGIENISVTVVTP